MATTTVVSGPTNFETKLDMYRSQVALRQFETRAYDMFLENLVKGTITFRSAKRPSRSGSRPR